MEIMLKINQPTLEIMHKLVDQKKVKKMLKKLLIKHLCQQTTKAALEVKDGKMD